MVKYISVVNVGLTQVNVAHAAKAYLGLGTMKSLEVFLLPWKGMPAFHCKLHPPPPRPKHFVTLTVRLYPFILLDPVVKRMNNAIYRTNCYPLNTIEHPGPWVRLHATLSIISAQNEKDLATIQFSYD